MYFFKSIKITDSGQSHNSSSAVMGVMCVYHSTWLRDNALSIQKQEILTMGNV